MFIEHHYIEREGYRWHVVTSGPQDAPPALLLHCWVGNWTLWQKTIEHLDGQYRFIVPDHLGFGQSDKPNGDYYRIDQQAKRSLAILQHFGYERAHVMGHSMGGHISLTFAGMYPKAVERLVVIAPLVTGRLHPIAERSKSSLELVRRGWASPVEWAIKLVPKFPDLSLQFARLYMLRPENHREAALYWLQQLTADGQVYASAWSLKAFVEWDATPLLPNISAPTMAFWGEEDCCVAVSECDVLAAHIPNFEHMRLPSIGHFPMIEAWEIYIREVEEFLRG